MVDGIDDFKDDLEELRENAQELEGEHALKWAEVYNDQFMQKYTNFDSLKDFLENSPWPATTVEGLQDVPQSEIDSYVDKHTYFSNGEEMLEKAEEEWAFGELGL